MVSLESASGYFSVVVLFVSLRLLVPGSTQDAEIIRVGHLTPTQFCGMTSFAPAGQKKECGTSVAGGGGKGTRC